MIGTRYWADNIEKPMANLILIRSINLIRGFDTVFLKHQRSQFDPLNITAFYSVLYNANLTLSVRMGFAAIDVELVICKNIGYNQQDLISMSSMLYIFTLNATNENVTYQLPVGLSH